VEEKTLDEQIAALKERKREEKLKEEQRTKLLPRLYAEINRIQNAMLPLAERQDEVARAIAMIDNGAITSFCLRKPRTKKAETNPDEGEE